MEDIAPSLLEKIRVSFIRNIESNAEIRSLNQVIQNGAATYIEAEKYGICVGEALSEAFSENLSSAVLPDGRMYFNIADRVIRPLLEEDYELVSATAAEVQKALNLKAGIGIKVQTAAVDTDRIDGLINSVVSADQFDDVAWILDEPVINFSLSAVTETLKAKRERCVALVAKAEKCLQPASVLSIRFLRSHWPDCVPTKRFVCTGTVSCGH